MNCQNVRDKMADLLLEGLNAGNSEYRKHLESCPECWQEWQQLHETWSGLGILPEQQPGQRVRENFYRMLEETRREELNSSGESLWKRVVSSVSRLRLPGPALRLTAAALIVTIGFSAGFFMGSDRSQSGTRVEELSREVNSLQQQMTLAMLSQDSASARLQGIAMTSKVQEPSPSLIKALLETLNNDPSVNVRLSAVDALYLFAGRQEVREELSASLARQESPLVQIALIDLIVSIKERQAVSALKQLINDKKVIPEVQQRARRGISQII